MPTLPHAGHFVKLKIYIFEICFEWTLGTILIDIALLIFLIKNGVFECFYFAAVYQSKQSTALNSATLTFRGMNN